MVPQILLVPIMMLAAQVDAFTALPRHVGVAKVGIWLVFLQLNILLHDITLVTNRSVQYLQPFTLTSSILKGSRADLSAREYQLEELEDKEECETEVWLNDDGTVTLGLTNGPQVKSYKGDWHIIETASDAGKEEKRKRKKGR